MIMKSLKKLLKKKWNKEETASQALKVLNY